MTKARIGLFLLALMLSGAATLRAQTRNERIAAAFRALDEFETARAVELVRGAVNPAEGPQDSLWFRGVQLLAQLLTEEGREAEAAVWLRWALRLAPGAAIDSVDFPPAVAQAARAARAAVGAGSPGDAVTRTSWQWLAPGAGGGRGILRIESPAMSRPVRAFVQGVGTTESGRTVIVTAGTYEIQAAAEGYLATQLRREVLPGLTTVLTFSLTPVPPVAPPVAQPPVVAPPRVEPGPAPAVMMSAEARAAALRQIVPITVQRFGAPATCGTAAFVGREGLLVTTYHAIRGAEAVEIGRVSAEIRVAAYDAAANVAVLQVPAIRSEVLSITDAAAAGQPAWAFGFSNCRAPEDVRVTIAGRTEAQLQLTDSLSDATNLGPLVNAAGAIVGFSTGARAALTGARLQQALDAARRNAGAGQVLTVAQVALRENHAFGSVTIASDITGAQARITPLETWHWPGTERTGALPLTFAGPMGRYRLEILSGGAVQQQTELTVRPATADRLAVAAEPVAARPRPAGQPQPAVQRRGGGGAGVILAVLGIGGAGAAACLLVLCKGGDEGPGPGPGTQPGNIVISVPNPSIIFRIPR